MKTNSSGHSLLTIDLNSDENYETVCTVLLPRPEFLDRIPKNEMYFEFISREQLLFVTLCAWMWGDLFMAHDYFLSGIEENRIPYSDYLAKKTRQLQKTHSRYVEEALKFFDDHFHSVDSSLKEDFWLMSLTIIEGNANGLLLKFGRGFSN